MYNENSLHLRTDSHQPPIHRQWRPSYQVCYLPYLKVSCFVVGIYRGWSYNGSWYWKNNRITVPLDLGTIIHEWTCAVLDDRTWIMKQGASPLALTPSNCINITVFFFLSTQLIWRCIKWVFVIVLVLNAIFSWQIPVLSPSERSRQLTMVTLEFCSQNDFAKMWDSKDRCMGK